MFKRGDIVEIDGQLAVVVALAGEADTPEGHLAVWFGDPRTEKGRTGGVSPEVWTIPADYFTKAAAPSIRH